MLADTYAGLVLAPYNKDGPNTHPAYVHTNLYLEWLANPKASKDFHLIDTSRETTPIRPVWVLMAHTSCGAAKKLADDPSAWSPLALGDLMRQEEGFRSQIIDQYTLSTRPLAPLFPNVKATLDPDYLAVQILRKNGIRAIEALEHQIGVMLDRDKKILERNPLFESPQVVLLVKETGTARIWYVNLLEEYDRIVLPLPPAGQPVRSLDVRHDRAPR